MSANIWRTGGHHSRDMSRDPDEESPLTDGSASANHTLVVPEHECRLDVPIVGGRTTERAARRGRGGAGDEGGAR